MSMTYDPAVKRGETPLHLTKDGSQTLCGLSIGDDWLNGARSDSFGALLGLLPVCDDCNREALEAWIATLEARIAALEAAAPAPSQETTP